MKKRLKYIDIARGLAMIFIVFGHTIVYSEHCDLIYQFLYSFHVALFFVISGYTFNIPTNYHEFVKNKFIRIMIPYFIWSFLFLIPYILLGQTLHLGSEMKASFNVITQCKNILYGNGNNFALKQNSSLWFLPAVFIMEICYSLFIKVFNRGEKFSLEISFCFIQIIIGFISTLILIDIFLPWGINSTIQFGVFFYMGYLLKKRLLLDKIRFKYLALFVFSILGILCCFLNYKRVSAIDYNYGNYILAILSGFTLSVSVLLICVKIKENILLEYLGKNTMSILIFHKIVLMICQSKLGIITSLLKNSTWYIELLIVFGISSCAILFSLAINIFAKRIFPELIGEKRKKEVEG